MRVYYDQYPQGQTNDFSGERETERDGGGGAIVHPLCTDVEVGEHLPKDGGGWVTRHLCDLPKDGGGG